MMTDDEINTYVSDLLATQESEQKTSLMEFLTPSPSKMMTMYDIYGKLPQILPKPIIKKNYTCIWTQNEAGKKERVCHFTSTDNYIECEKTTPDQSPYCRINIRSADKKIPYIKFPEGVTVNIEQNTAVPKYYVLGTFKKSQLPQVMTSLSNEVPYREIDNVSISLGYEPPHKSCGWLWWREKCRPYSEDPNYSLRASLRPPFLQWQLNKKRSLK